MGRPLKIQKYATPAPAQGDVNYYPGAAVRVDVGFNPWSQLTNPVYPSTFNSNQYLGVVGGANTLGGTAVATPTNPVVKCRVFIPGAGAEDDGYIIRQKGVRKYLVAAVSAVNDEDMVVGKTYTILTVGTTNWAACGGPVNARAGDVFTCTAKGSGNGTAQLVGVCVLANQADGALTSGNMNITFTFGDSTATLISKLTNKYAYDFTGGEVGGVTNTNPNSWQASKVQQNVRYAANFFTDEGTEQKSGTKNQANGTGQQNILGLAIVENYTS